MPLALSAAGQGWSVIGYDVNPKRVAAIAGGNPTTEDISPDVLRKALASGNFRPTADEADLDAATMFVICVPTPLDESHLPDLTAVRAATETVARHMKSGDLVILESTTYPGTTEEVVMPLLEKSGLACGVDFLLAFSPERIDPGNPTYGLENTPKIVGGVTAQATKAAAAFYEPFVGSVVKVRSPKEAEMAKLLENTFRHVNIALVNELAICCEEMGIDIWEVVDAAATKPFGFLPFYPGPGTGGHCIPLDPAYLSWKVRQFGHPVRFVELAEEVNLRMPKYVVDRLAEALNERAAKALNGASILVLGVAYKADVGDTRESPAIEVMKLLSRKGSRVSFHDPHVSQFKLDGEILPSVPLTSEALSQADAVVILTAHAGVDYEGVLGAAPLVFDTRNATQGIEAANLVRL
jgi:nucleotide sugar dehydrogenase